MIDGDIVQYKACEQHGCPKIPSFALPGEASKRCADNKKLDDDTNARARQCESTGCLTQPSLGQPGDTSRRCSRPKIDGDIDFRHKSGAAGCTKKASFSQAGESAEWYSTHQKEGCVDEVNKRCSSCIRFDKIYDKGLAKHVNPITGKKDMFQPPYQDLSPHEH